MSLYMLDSYFDLRYTQHVYRQHNGNKISDTPNLTDK